MEKNRERTPSKNLRHHFQELPVVDVNKVPWTHTPPPGIGGGNKTNQEEEKKK